MPHFVAATAKGELTLKTLNERRIVARLTFGRRAEVRAVAARTPDDVVTHLEQSLLVLNEETIVVEHSTNFREKQRLIALETRQSTTGIRSHVFVQTGQTGEVATQLQRKTIAADFHFATERRES